MYERYMYPRLATKSDTRLIHFDDQCSDQNITHSSEIDYTCPLARAKYAFSPRAKSSDCLIFLTLSTLYLQ
jgi:regulator of sigma D